MGCPGSPTTIYAEFLKANPAARGKIILRSGSSFPVYDGYDKTRTKILQEMKDLGIPKSRLRFFKSTMTQSFGEFWIVP